MANSLAYQDNQHAAAAPVYFRPGEEMKESESKDGLETLTRPTAFGSHAGTLQNYTAEGHTVLLPTPSDDPNDPLNWSQAYKWYITFLVVLAAFMCNLTNAGPSIAILQTSAEFRVLPTKATYLFSGSPFAQGLSSFFWAPLVAKYGKRPVYISSFILYTATNFGAGACKTWDSQLALRILAGIGAGAGEILGPSVIADIWFVHERGLAVGMFTSSLSIGVAFGLFLAGQLTQYLGWRYIYWVFGAMMGASTVLIILTFPETTFHRPALAPVYKGYRAKIDHSKRHGFVKKMALYSGTHTKEPFWQLLLRPFVIVAYPAVLWATMVTAVTVGFLIAVSTNVAIAFGEAYHYGPAQVGLCFLAGVIGSIVAIIFGGAVIDQMSSSMAKRNGGLREPEMRLPAMALVVITAPLALLLYGAGIQHHLSWIVPTIGLGLINFSIVTGGNVAIVYAIDCYKPVTNEVTTAILGYKSVVGFILSFYTNQWVEGQGYQHAFGEMAGISAFVLVMFVPLYIWGKRIRQSSLEWRSTRLIRWDQDRDDLVLEE